MIARHYITIAVLLFATFTSLQLSAQAQQSDFFPLSVGNKWTYKYSSMNYQVSLNRVTSEGGTCTCTVIGRTPTQDSVRWIISELHAITRSISNYLPGRDTLYSTTDSTTFEIVEMLGANHIMYRPGVISGYWMSAFSFSIADDTSKLLRYYPTTVEDTIPLSFQKPPAPAGEYYLNLTLVRNKGVAGISCQSGGELELIGLQCASAHDLQAALLTSVEGESRSSSPMEFQLHQNYPNPFNPSTNIEFELPHATHVKLAIYDILGRLVVNLLDSQLARGQYDVVWNASAFSSGLYFCRFTDGVNIRTIKMSLVK